MSILGVTGTLRDERATGSRGEPSQVPIENRYGVRIRVPPALLLLPRRRSAGFAALKLLAYGWAMNHAADRQWLLDHLDGQARYLAALTRHARKHPDDAEVLTAVRDEVFTLRETLETLAVPYAVVSNDDWHTVPSVPHRDGWPTAADLAP